MEKVLAQQKKKNGGNRGKLGKKGKTPPKKIKLGRTRLHCIRRLHATFASKGGVVKKKLLPTTTQHPL